MRVPCVALLLLVAVNAVAPPSWPTEEPFWPHHPTRTVHVLDGTWEFGYEANIPDVINIDPKTVETPETATVPSAFDVQMPGIEGRRGTAFYRTTIPLAAGKKGLIHFAACSFYCNVFVSKDATGSSGYVNIGDHRASGYAPFWLSIPAATSSSTTSRELLVVADNRFNSTTAPTHTGGDFYNYGGLTRSVMVHEQPAANYIKRVETTTVSASAGHIDVAVVVGGDSPPSHITVSLAFDGGDGSSVTLAVANGVGRTSATVPSPKPWSPGSPNLHTLSVKYGDDEEVVRFGLRTLGADPTTGRFTINGVVTKLHGYNRHTMWPDTGSACTLEQVQTDVQLLKEAGANYVRGAHYPQDQRFLDLCDEAGIVVWEETLGPGTKTANLQDPYFLKYQVQAVNEMISASFNHPSGIFFAFYNEGPSSDPKACPGYNVSASAVHARVPTTNKLVTWASNKGESDVCLDLADVVSFNNYPAWYNHAGDVNYPKTYWPEQATWVMANQPGKPFFVSETGAGGVFEWTNSSDPKWSQGYMDEVVMADATTIMADDRFSGLTLWQFSDIKANTGDTAKCGQCDYLPGVQPPTCGFIDVSCSRPGGENHKGSVDFWRRKKQSFDDVAKLYNHTAAATAAAVRGRTVSLQ